MCVRVCFYTFQLVAIAAAAAVAAVAAEFNYFCRSNHNKLNKMMMVKTIKI